MKAYGHLSVEELTDLLIYDRDFPNLQLLLEELWAYRETACEYCDGPIGDEDIMHVKCPRDPWCECGRSQLKGSCDICDYPK